MNADPSATGRFAEPGPTEVNVASGSWRIR